MSKDRWRERGGKIYIEREREIERDTETEKGDVNYGRKIIAKEKNTHDSNVQK